MNVKLVPLKIVNIYQDPQYKEGLIGKAVLLEKIGDGLPFILEEDDAYRLEEWEGIDLQTLDICTVYIRKEIKKSRVPSEYKREPIKSYDNYLVDRFLVFNGIEMF